MKDLTKTAARIRKRFRPDGEDAREFGRIAFRFDHRRRAATDAYFLALRGGLDAVLIEEEELVIYASERDFAGAGEADPRR